MPPLVVAQGTACALALEIWNDRKPGTGVPKILVLCMVSKVKDRLYVIDIYILCRYVFVDTDTYAIYIYHMAVPFLCFQVHGIRIQPRHSRDGVGHLVTKSDNDESALEGGKRACVMFFENLKSMI